MMDMQRHLREMFEDVRHFLVSEGLGRLGVVRMNAKGDVTREFDFLAEARIIEWCRQAIAEPVRILTEERGEVRSGQGRPPVRDRRRGTGHGRLRWGGRVCGCTGRLDPGEHMAGLLLIVEAGGVVSDRAGRPLAPITSMTQNQSVVAAANRTLHTEILAVLDGRCP